MPVNLLAKVTVTKDRLREVMRSIDQLGDTRVMVGIPAIATDRGDPKSPITNAEIGYIHEYGAPEANIPARPHLYPTVRAEQPLIVRELKRAGTAAFEGEPQKMVVILERLGLTVATAVKRRLTMGVPPPLAPSTVESRIARRSSATWRVKRREEVAANVAAGKAPGEGIFTPLIDTGNYMSHVTYVLRSRRTKKDVKGAPAPEVLGKEQFSVVVKKG